MRAAAGAPAFDLPGALKDALIAAGLPYRLSLVVASLGGIATGMALELRKERRR